MKEEVPLSGELFFLDECDLHLCPGLVSSWSEGGKQVKIETPGEDEVERLLGIVNYRSGEVIYHFSPEKQRKDVLALLKEGLERHLEKFWYIVLDNAPSHTSYGIEDFWEENQKRIALVYLPTYSPWLNPLERLWRYLRGKVTANHYFGELKKLVEAVDIFFRGLRKEAVLGIIH